MLRGSQPWAWAGQDLALRPPTHTHPGPAHDPTVSSEGLVGAADLSRAPWAVQASCTVGRTTLPGLSEQDPGRVPAVAWGRHSLMLGCPETLRRMSTSFSVASRSSCASWELKLPPPVTSMIFTAYSWHVGLWMQRLTTLLTPLGCRAHVAKGPYPLRAQVLAGPGCSTL